MSHPSLANSQSVPVGPSAAPSFSFPRLVFTTVDVHKASPQALKVIRGLGVPVSENIGWAASSPSSTSSSPPPSDCSSPSSASSDGQVEPASGPSRRTKQSKAARRKAAGSRTRTKVKASSDVTRPPNCFFIFRQQFTSNVPEAYLEAVKGKQNNLSRIAGLVWQSMSEEEKEPYRQKQEELAREHKLRNPDYQFAPERRAPKKKRVNKTKDFDAAVSAYIGSLHQQKLSEHAIAVEAERFRKEYKAELASASPTGYPARSPVDPPSGAFVDPLYPPGDRTPQPRPAHPVVIDLPPAPTSAPSSASTAASVLSSSAPLAVSSAPISPMDPVAYTSQTYAYDQLSFPASEPWPTQTPDASYWQAPPYLSAPAQHFTMPTTYQQDATFAYQQYPAEGPTDFTIAPVDVFPLQHPMAASQLEQQEPMLPAFDPALFDNLMQDMPAFDPSFSMGPQDIPFNDQAAFPSPYYHEQHLAMAPEQQLTFTAPLMDVPGLGNYAGFDISALQQQVTQEEQQFFAQNGQFLHPYSEGVHVQWNA